MKITAILLLSMCTMHVSFGQALLKGKVMDSKTDVPLDGATIYNLTQNDYRKAAFNGQYSIAAKERDVIIFSSTGYRPDTIEISATLLQDDLDIGLKALPLRLDTVMVTARSYAEDSLQRRSDYQEFYAARIHNVTGGNRPSDGVGISISPLTYLSRKEQSKRKLRKRLAYNEQQAYIDYHFSGSYVHRLTGLSGQQLQLFMLKHRPSYTFMRNASKEDLFNYINESLKKFKKDQAPLAPK